MAERRLQRLAAALACLLLAACASQKEKADLVVGELVTLLPGSYDNLAQSRTTGGEHTAVRLMVAPVQAPLVGDHVFYVQEMAADDPRRVLAQRLYVVDAPAAGENPVMVQLDFTEPARWRDGHLRRDLFRGLLPTDLRARAGCDVIWTRTPTGFSGANDALGCRIASRATGETLRAEQRMELDRDGIAIFERHRDASGVVVYGDSADPWYRFIRRADAPW
ncbi:MAG: chromophore lyase CpcT/CpeT [Steroidobacteraceae bacterium]